MMAAEVSSEDTGSVTAGTGVAGGGGPETAPFPYYPKTNRVRVAELGQAPKAIHRQHSNTSPDSLPDMSMIYHGSTGDLTEPLLSATGSGGAGGGHTVFQGTSSGTVGGMCYSPTSERPASRISPTSTGLDVFPPLPPPPPPPPDSGGLIGTMDESEIQDIPDPDDEEVAFPLSAPPTNQ